MRAFTSIQVPDGARAAIRPALSALGTAGIPGLRTVPERATHITLRFLGNVPTEGIGRLGPALRRAALRVRPFRLRFGGIGSFPQGRAPSVIWVGIEGDLDGLSLLRGEVDSAVESIFPATEASRGDPHITLARLGRRSSGTDRRRALELARDSSPGPEDFVVRSVSLMESTLTAKGSLHRCIGEFPLGSMDGDA